MLAETLRDVEDMIPSIDDFISEENGEWQIDERLVKVIDLAGSRMFQSAKMSAIQGLGAQAKIEKGLQGAFAADIIENKMPILDLIGEFAGINVKKYITKHPQAIAQIVQMFGPMMQNFGKNNPGGQVQGGM